MRIFCTVTYDGSGYKGFQVQPEGKTIQGEIERALNIIHKKTNKAVRISSASRTDTGVHALDGKFHFDTSIEMNENAWKISLNRLLPEDIRIIKAQIVEESFHARYNSTSKIYRYYFQVGNIDYQKHVFQYKHITTVYGDVSIELMKDQLSDFIGKHDFTSFCRKDNKKSPLKEIYAAKLVQISENTYYFEFHGSGFLRYQIRTMVGSLFMIGKRKSNLSIKEMIELKERKLAGMKADANGLVLTKIFYEGNNEIT